MESLSPAVFPFSAVVGQEEMKLALILNVIDPSVGGVLIMGHRGTGKSTVVRALADLLPQILSIAGCAYSCDPGDEQNFCSDCREIKRSGAKLIRQKSAVPVVELPLGATEDRVCGTIDIEQALRSGFKRFDPGLLARANRGFLYIDEVNLLEDHLVDLLLDVAATGINRVERESVSVEHPARFVLIGSGNPEEGELRPQLLDRFGLHVEVKTEEMLDHRVKIVERREAFDRDREGFRAAFADEQKQLRKKITSARKNFANVNVERALLRQIVQLCSDLKIDGHRGELTITRAARALAALEGRKKVTESDVKRVAIMSLRHRFRRDLLEETASAGRIEQALKKIFAPSGGGAEDGEGEEDGPSFNARPGKGRGMGASAPHGESSVNSNGNPNGTVGAEAGSKLGPVTTVEAAAPPKLLVKRDSKRGPSQRDSRIKRSRSVGVKRAIYDHERGRYARSIGSSVSSTKAGGTVALDATVRAAAGAGFRIADVGKDARLTTDTGRLLSADSLRFKLFKRKRGRLFIFAIDLSGSMALNRIGQAKAVILALLRRSYIERDSVAIVGFRGTSAELLLPPSRSIIRARRVLDAVSVGGGTPLAAGLACSLKLAKRLGPKSGEMILLLFTDGQANVALSGNGSNDRAGRQDVINKEITLLGVQLRKAGLSLIVADTQNGFRSTGKARLLAQTLGAEWRRLPQVATDDSKVRSPAVQSCSSAAPQKTAFASNEGGTHELA